VPDPTIQAICGLTAELQALRRRVESLEAVEQTTTTPKRAAEG